jgi:deoxyribonuclease IV
MIRMTSKVRFGPAGNPPGYKGKTVNVCDYIRGRGLDAYEYQATYGVRISKKSARRLKENASLNGVLVSMHAPYYINLCSPKENVIKNSINRLVQSAQASQWMGAYRIVFHPGFYTKYTPREALQRCKNTISELIERLETLNLKDYIFAPETTGKKSQLGTLDEIINICQSFDNFTPTVDFAHLHARYNGIMEDRKDYERVFDKLENELGLKSLHCHFTHVEYTDAGERRHHILGEEEFGPPLEPLIEVIIDWGWDVTMISESPILDEDALVMKAIYQEALEKV